MDELIPSTASYTSLLTGIQERIRTAQMRAADASGGCGQPRARAALLEFWLRDFPSAKGGGLGYKGGRVVGPGLKAHFSGYAWPDEAIVQEPLAQLTWFHNLALLEKVKEPEERLWYARAAVENGWSRNVLVLQIESGLYRRRNPIWRSNC